MPITIPPTIDLESCLRTTSGTSGLARARLRAIKSPVSTKPLDCPFTILIDSAEQLPFTFQNLRADAAQHHRPLIIQTIRRHIPIAPPPERLSIDYSILNHERTIGIERKSLEDFFNTLAGRTRDRFERKLSIINLTYQCFTVIVEAEWSTILYDPPEFREILPKTLFRTTLAWMQRYPTIHWLFMPNRWCAEQAAFRVLERWWKERERAERERVRMDRKMENGS